jgi:esterase/lipase
LSVLTEIIGGNVAEVVERIVGVFKLSPAAKAEIEKAKQENIFELAKMQSDMESRVQEAMAREIEAASSNIRAEAASGDKYTSRARPTFLYLVYAILILQFIVAPVIRSFGVDFMAVELPTDLYWLFGSGYLGYTGARSWEKVGQRIK